VVKFEKGGDRIKVFMQNGDSFEVETVMVATGRVPNIEKLDLEKAGVEYNGKGVKVNEYL
jgi:glutathione reductase (NADPH)